MRGEAIRMVLIQKIGNVNSREDNDDDDDNDDE
jgi:hypothetical protein